MYISHTFFKRSFIFTHLILAVFTFASTVRASGEVDSGFIANAYNASSAITAATQPDGKIVIGGNFTVANGVPKSSIIRVNSDGTTDPTFNSGEIINGTVNSIAIQTSGKILVAGDFTLTGATYKDLIRLNTDGSLDTSFANTFSTDAGTKVTKITLKNDTDIYLIGDIYGNTSGRKSAIRLNTNGEIVPDFALPPFGTINDLEVLSDGKLVIAVDTVIFKIYDYGPVDGTYPAKAANNRVLSIAVQPDGKTLIGGAFTGYDNFPQPYLTRLNADSSIDVTFNPNGTRTNGIVSSIEIAADGKIIIAGLFTQYDNVNRSGIARLNADGTLDASFNPALFGFLALQNDGKILIKTTNEVRRLNADGTADALFNTVTLGGGGTVFALAQQPDGKVIAGGSFLYANGAPRKVLARYNADGSLDTTFVQTVIVDFPFGNQSTVYAITIQSDGKILVGGQLSSGFIRFNTDGTRDTTFQPAAPLSNPYAYVIYDIDILSDGKILVNGQYKLETNGALSNDFTVPVFSAGVARVAVEQPDGKILIAGAFTQINGVARGYIARLNANGALDPTFNPPLGANSSVRDIALQTDGKIVLVGTFTGLNGDSTKKYIGRLNSDGSLDASFNPILTNPLNTVKIQPDGKILIGGAAQTVNGISRNGYARLNANGTLDATFIVGSGANGNIFQIALQSDNKILLGGNFSRINDAPKINIARLLNSATARTLFDYDGDGRADVAVFRPSNGVWYVLGSQNNAFTATQFGEQGDRIAPADYDGDGRTDLAVFRENVAGANGQAYFYILDSANNSFRPVQFGQVGDVPVSGDWDGDGIGDLAVYRNGTSASASSFFYRPSSQPGADFRSIVWGAAGDVPVAGDFDGDGRQDAAVFRPSNAQWYVLRSSDNQLINVAFGRSTDVLVPADYNGDGRTDFGVFRPENATWYTSSSVTNPSTNFNAVQFGVTGDVPAAADYDGDGRADVAVFRPANGIWYLQRSTQGFTGVQFGASGDKPAPNAYVR